MKTFPNQRVAAGFKPAVEGGILSPGWNHPNSASGIILPVASGRLAPFSPDWESGSTAARMAAATGVLFLALFLLCAAAQAQSSYSLRWGYVASGGGQSATNSYTLSGAVGLAGVSHILYPPTTGTDYFTNTANTPLPALLSVLLSNDVANPFNPSGTNLTLVSFSPTSTNGGSLAFQAGGASLWEKRYDGPGNSNDVAQAVAVDVSGNVLVTGYSHGTSSGYDYYTAKYAAADGALLWSNRYNGPGNYYGLGNSYDSAAAVAVDASGNVLVTGTSVGTSSYYDYYTAKYAAADGAVLWSNRYNGPYSLGDYARAVAVDASGNVLVTGNSAGAGLDDDYYTAKYAAADGALLWSNRYNGPGNYNDVAQAVAVDASGNVLVTGTSAGTNGNSDYFTAKYAAADGAVLWSNRYNGPANSVDIAQAVAVDASGNVLVTGYSAGPSSGYDYFTAKYAAADGAVLWTNRYTSLGNYDDVAQAVAVDASGNVLVTGYTYSPNGGYDYFTVKYAAADGAVLWTNRYNGPGNSNDVARAVAVDASGNVLVTGSSTGTNGNSDYFTAKYAATDGAVLWSNRYNGPGNSNDVAQSVAVDASGNVLVTGSSTGTNGYPDYFTAKYAGTDRLLYTPPTNFFGTDSFSYVVQDSFGLTATGTVVVTVYSPPFITAQPAGATNLVGTTASFTVLADGTAPLGFQWLKAGSPLADGGHVSGATSNILALSNVQSADATNYAVIITNAYGSVTSSVATLTLLLPPGIAQEPQNAFAQCGTGSATFSVTATGTAPLSYQWRFNDAPISGAAGTNYTVNPTTLTNAGNYSVIVTNLYGSITSSIATLTLTNQTPTVASADALSAYRNLALTMYPSALTSNDVPGSCNGYNPYLSIISVSSVSTNGGSVAQQIGGSSHWTNRYDGPADNVDRASAVVVDGGNNVYVTGHSAGDADDFLTIAFSSAGLPLWTNRYNGPDSYLDIPTALAVDSSNNVYVAGYSMGSGTDYDYATIAYSATGVALWTNRYNGADNYVDAAAAMVVDRSNNVYVAGQSWANGSDRDYLTVAYSSAGIPLWTNRYNGTGNHLDIATAIALDRSNDDKVYVTGMSSPIGGVRDYATVAYSRAGIPLWTNRYNGPFDSDDYAKAVAVDRNGNVYVTGFSVGDDATYDFATVAYSSTGLSLWTNRYSGPGNGEDYAVALAVNSSNNVFVTGYSMGSGTDYDYATIAYSDMGVALWTNRYNGLVNNRDEPRAIAVDGSANIFITGTSVGSGSSNDIVTVAYSNAGFPMWTNRFSSPGSHTDVAEALSVDYSSNVVVAGYSWGGGSDDYVTIKYRAIGADQFVYTPPTNFTGTDSFTYVVQDSLGLTATGTVTVTVSPLPPPTITQQPTVVNGNFTVGYSGVAGAAYVVQVRPNFITTWQTFTNLTASPAGAITFSAPINEAPMRFFRVIPAP